MRRLTRLLAATLLLASLAAWAAVVERRLDFFPDRDGLRGFNGWFEADLSDRPVLSRSGGFLDVAQIYRLEATPADADHAPAPGLTCGEDDPLRTGQVQGRDLLGRSHAVLSRVIEPDLVALVGAREDESGQE